MELVLVSNYMNHYQANFADSVIRSGNSFQFISMKKVPEDRLKMGFSSEFDNQEYVMYAYDDINATKEIIDQCDILISTYYANDLIKSRIRSNKLIFIESERIFKPVGNPIMSYIRNIIRFFKYKQILREYYNFGKSYFLLLGQYAIDDHIKCGVNSNKILKFAYFPSVSKYEEKKYVTDGIIRFIWVGRFLEWKHPESAIEVVKRLCDCGYSVKLTMIGNGSMEQKLKKLSFGYDIEFTGALPFQEIRKYLHNADVYLFTSDYSEGWGCVLNEAMAEGNAVIACSQAGSSTFLMKDGENGLIYDGSEKDLYSKALKYVCSPELISKLGKAGQETINRIWNSDIAVKNLIIQFTRLNEGKVAKKIDGPCGLYM